MKLIKTITFLLSITNASMLDTFKTVKKANEDAKSDQNDDDMRAAVAGAIGHIPDAHKAK